MPEEEYEGGLQDYCGLQECEAVKTTLSQEVSRLKQRLEESEIANASLVMHLERLSEKYQESLDQIGEESRQTLSSIRVYGIAILLVGVVLGWLLNSIF